MRYTPGKQSTLSTFCNPVLIVLCTIVENTMYGSMNVVEIAMVLFNVSMEDA